MYICINDTEDAELVGDGLIQTDRLELIMSPIVKAVSSQLVCTSTAATDQVGLHN